MRNIFILAVMITVFTSCRKYPDFDELSYKPIVVTNYDATADFSSYQTYYMSDSVTSIGDDINDSVAPASISGPIVDAIVANMDSRGYTRVLSQSLADIGINTAVIKITTTVQTYPPSYWWGYPGYGYGGYYPYYGYGYGGYYSYSYSYTTGSLMIQAADLMNIDTVGKKINILWTNWDAGVLGTTAQNTQGAVSSVNQAFKQSPYFKTN